MSVMSRSTSIVQAFATEIVVVAEFLFSQPRVDRLDGFDGGIDSLADGVPIDGWPRPGDVGSMLCIAEDALEPTLLQIR